MCLWRAGVGHRTHLQYEMSVMIKRNFVLKDITLSIG